MLSKGNAMILIKLVAMMLTAQESQELDVGQLLSTLVHDVPSYLNGYHP
jgi:hypothetical protein